MERKLHVTISLNFAARMVPTPTDVPQMLRAIALGNKVERDNAWRRGWDNLYHQGGTYEATAVISDPVILRNRCIL